mmetsp:Transcript_8770/g.15498  ORF Transcript_8770/g.15498 Transcript_8770/m.15498 type:complete len:81 (+) Transcript_8770:252-494(+)
MYSFGCIIEWCSGVRRRAPITGYFIFMFFAHQQRQRRTGGASSVTVTAATSTVAGAVGNEARQSIGIFVTLDLRSQQRPS